MDISPGFQFDVARFLALLADDWSALGDRPTANIPAAPGGYKETAAAYRFFDNEKVTYEGILTPHAARTIQRIAAGSGSGGTRSPSALRLHLR